MREIPEDFVKPLGHKLGIDWQSLIRPSLELLWYTYIRKQYKRFILGLNLRAVNLGLER